MADPIELADVSYRYRSDGRDVLAVAHVSFRVEPSEFLCILDPSG